jgi:hypothetical protein
VSVQERVWRGREGAWLRPFQQQARIGARGCSRRLQRLACDFALEESFGTAVERLREHHGVALSASRVRLVTLEHAGRMARQQLQRAPVRTLPARGADTIVVEADGSMLPHVEFGEGEGDRRKRRKIFWQEARLLAAQARGCAEAVYAVSFGDVSEAGQQWAHAARESGWAIHSCLHAIGDGAEWIDKQRALQFGRQSRYLVDFFHVCEYLAAAAPPGQPDWLQRQKQRLRDNQAETVIEELSLRLELVGSPDEQAPVRCAHRYLSNRRHALDYRSALEAGLPIGSGLIESGHRHIFQHRLKIAGAAWLRSSAETIAHARALRANGHWRSYWFDSALARN